MKKIVVVEDDFLMREELESILRKANYAVECITEFNQVADGIIKAAPELVLLDLNLPGITGFEICRELRRKSSIPILVLTSRDQLKDELHALHLGADEYLGKPCHKERLLARIANLLRRETERGNFIEAGKVRLDPNTYTLYVGKQAQVLPENQGIIMALLLSHINQVVTKEMLFHALWGTTAYVDENALQVNMTRLKKRLSTFHLEQRIITVRGLGYCLKLQEEGPGNEDIVEHVEQI